MSLEFHYTFTPLSVYLPLSVPRLRAYFKENLYLSIQNFANDISLVVLHLTLYSYIPVFYFFMVHHYKKQISLYIFVHHCTFCASSLHVKTSLAMLLLSCSPGPSSSHSTSSYRQISPVSPSPFTFLFLLIRCSM